MTNNQNNINNQEEMSVSTPQIQETDTMKSLLEQLARPFPPEDISFRVQSIRQGNNQKLPQAVLVAYIDSRDVMERLDEVFPLAWEDSYQKVELNTPKGFLQGWECTITITLPDGRQISRKDVGEISDIEALKGGYSDSIKRCAVKFGIGRHLYKLPVITAPVYPQRDTKIAAWDDWVYCSSKGITGYFIKPNLNAIEAKASQKKPKTKKQQRHENVMDAYGANNQGQSQQNSPQQQAHGGPSQQEYEQCVSHVGNLMRDLNIPIEQTGAICRKILKVELMDNVALNQLNYELLQQLYALLNPVKLLMMNAQSFGLDNNGVYQFASQYLNKSVQKISDLFCITDVDVKNILEQVKQHFATANRQAN